MKPITYLCFTLLSILIQFCLMDFINERFQNDTGSIDHNSRNVIKNLSYIKDKPQALFYRTEAQKNYMDSTEKYSNSSLPITKFALTTEPTSTIFDLVYDENTSMTDITLTTETYFTNSDLDNVTDITFFDKKNNNESPSAIPNQDISRKTCYCDLLYKNCDINCCCDSDCSDKEKDLFQSCEAGYRNYNSPSRFLCNTDMSSDIFYYLFCIKKINLPDNRKISKNRLSTIDVNKYLKWHNNMKDKPSDKFIKTMYGSGSPIWFLKNSTGTLNVLEYPVTVTNQYCSRQEPMKYLINTHVKCFVKIEELHMLQVLKLFSDTKVVSPIEKTINSTLLNCTALHCTNWTVNICNEFGCIIYNEEFHDPYCSDDQCYNIGTKVQYIFQCNATNIMKAAVKIYVKNISRHQFVQQEILVDYFIGNESTVIKFSGNPGYVNGLPVIASYIKNNHTHYFYNRTHDRMNYLVLPFNENGECVLQNMKHNVVKFGQNKRYNCRLPLEQRFVTFNKTDGCLKIQAKLLELLKLNTSVYISPFGNPTDVKDEKWLILEKFNVSNIYGESGLNKRFVCHNLVTRFAFIMIMATENINNVEENLILKARVEGSARNVTFSVEKLSTIVTVDVSFIDASAPASVQYAPPPHFHFRLPDNFFLPPGH